MKLLDDYFALQEAIYKYFGYVEDWCVIPMEDCTDYLWYLTGEGHGDEVHFASSVEDFSNGEWYSDEIYTQRHLPKWVYRGEEYTMICVDTHTDGNKFLKVFSNEKELKDWPTGKEWLD